MLSLNKKKLSLNVENELDAQIKVVTSPRHQLLSSPKQSYQFKALIASKDRYQHVTKTLALWLRLHRGNVVTVDDIALKDLSSYDIIFFDLAMDELQWTAFNDVDAAGNIDCLRIGYDSNCESEFDQQDIIIQSKKEKLWVSDMSKMFPKIQYYIRNPVAYKHDIELILTERQRFHNILNLITILDDIPEIKRYHTRVSSLPNLSLKSSGRLNVQVVPLCQPSSSSSSSSDTMNNRPCSEYDISSSFYHHQSSNIPSPRKSNYFSSNKILSIRKMLLRSSTPNSEKSMMININRRSCSSRSCASLYSPRAKVSTVRFQSIKYNSFATEAVDDDDDDNGSVWSRFGVHINIPRRWWNSLFTARNSTNQYHTRSNSSVSF